MKKVLIFSGAGLSAPSGLRTFRDSNGLWEEHDVMEVCSDVGFFKNPQKVLDFYDERRSQLASVEPNYAHISIAKLWAEFKEQIVVMTQNVDDLLERAGCADVVHLHGFLPSVFCQRCGARQNIGYASIAGLTCKACGSHKMRHDIVMFGEQAPEYARMYAEVDECDMFVCIGTSGEVIDVANFARRKEYSILNNLEPSRLDRYFSKCYIESATTAADKIATDIKMFLSKE